MRNVASTARSMRSNHAVRRRQSSACSVSVAGMPRPRLPATRGSIGCSSWTSTHSCPAESRVGRIDVSWNAAAAPADSTSGTSEAHSEQAIRRRACARGAWAGGLRQGSKGEGSFLWGSERPLQPQRPDELRIRVRQIARDVDAEIVLARAEAEPAVAREALALHIPPGAGVVPRGATAHDRDHVEARLEPGPAQRPHPHGVFGLSERDLVAGEVVELVSAQAVDAAHAEALLQRQRAVHARA